MQWCKRIFFILLAVLTGVFLSVAVYVLVITNNQKNLVRDRVLQMNPEITRVEEVHILGGWGEWGKEYSLVVEVGGKRYRVWTTGDGVIGDRIELGQYP